MERTFIVTGAMPPVIDQRRALANADFKQDIETAVWTGIAQALADHRETATHQAKRDGGFKLPAGDGPARADADKITNQFRLPTGDDDAAPAKTLTPARKPDAGFALPK